LQDARVDSKSCDLITGQRVLPYIHGKALDETLAEAARILAPDGHFCASFFGPRHSFNDGKHPRHSFHSNENIYSLLDKAEFRIVDFHEIERKNIPTPAGEIIENF